MPEATKHRRGADGKSIPMDSTPDSDMPQTEADGNGQCSGTTEPAETMDFVEQALKAATDKHQQELQQRVKAAPAGTGQQS